MIKFRMYCCKYYQDRYVNIDLDLYFVYLFLIILFVFELLDLVVLDRGI